MPQAVRKERNVDSPMSEEGNTARTFPATPSQEKPAAAERPIGLLQLINRFLRQHFSPKSQDASLKEALEEVLEEHEEEGSKLALEEKNMLRNMLSFGELTVQDIMVPRTDIIAIEHTISFDDLKKHIVENRHTRIPIYRNTLDDVLGFLHIKDLVPMLCGDTPFDLQRVIRNVLFIPPSMKIIDLLVKMRLSGEHLAIVVDEYGGTDGLITMEDLIEELVGEIQDEHDDEEEVQEFIWISEHVADASARLSIEKLEEELGFEVVSEEEEKDFDTLGGLIFFFLGRVPARGEVIEHPSGLKLEILEADPRRIKRVRIIRHLHAPPPEQD